MKIAVIGSGIAGLSMAWMLSQQHHVTLFERRRRLGMGADATNVKTLLGDARVDVPLRVFYRGYYPNLLRLYERVGVNFELVDYSTSFSFLGGHTYFRYLNFLLGRWSIPYVQLRQLVGRRSLRLTFDVVRFYASLSRALSKGQMRDLTISEYLAKSGYSRAFSDEFLLPALSGICTCTYSAARDYPADIVADYFSRGLTMGGVSRATGGTGDVCRRLAQGVDQVETNAEVRGVRRTESAVLVRDVDGQEATFEHVVFATQANQALRLLEDCSEKEAKALSGFPYESSRVVMHCDPKLAPARRRDWSPVNFVVSDRHDKPMATIWMNAVQPELAGSKPVFQTWNPLLDPDPDLTLRWANFERPVVNSGSLRALGRLEALQQQAERRVWFCGSYASRGIPLLESAITSALALAERLHVSNPLDSPN